nr:immunoglobulin light chain junction region [Macaca mulatta]MOV82928.1 immunoglobulin light chain junction region [Macaca mulatta]
CLQHKSFPYTF